MIFEQLKKLIGRQYYPLNRLEISRKKLIKNYKYLSSIDKRIKVAPVLKSNAYGHGLIEVAKILDPLQPPFFCVDSLYEAYDLLKSKIKSPILIIGYVDPDNLLIKKLPFSYAVFNLKQFRAILKSQSQAKAHLFIDTGMNREGIRIDELEGFLKQLTNQEKNNIQGVMSHLAEAKNIDSLQTKKQIINFKNGINLLKKYSVNPKWIHLGNSEALLNRQLQLSSYSNVARTGLALYDSVLQLKTHIIQVKKIKEGEKVGYDFTYQAKKNGLIAVLPIGYNDGIDRRLSNKGVVLIKNTICPIIGRVSMNLTVVEVTAVKNIKVGDEVIVFSNTKGENTVINSAKKIEAIPYEILVHLERSTKRKII